MNELGRLTNKRLVILGCGYVGTAVARAALDGGMTVEALTRNPRRAAELTAMGLRVVVADLAAHAWHLDLDPRDALVLNCVSSGRAGLEGYRRSYVEGMKSVVAWARRGPASTLVYTSSTSVYPQGGGITVDESAATGGAGETSRILVEAESLLTAAADACRRWFVLRLAGVYGPGRHYLLDQLRAGGSELAGGGSHLLNLAHRDDIVAAVFSVLAAAPAVANRIFNVADDRPGTKTEVVAWLAARLGVPAPRFAGGKASRRRGFAAPPDRLISNARLKAELGWQPRYPSFREGYAGILSA